MLKPTRASTLILASFAFWAGLVLLVAMFGLGGRFKSLPSNAALAKPIPVVKISQHKASLGPIGNYAEVGSRPLLMFDRRPGAVLAAPGDNSAVELDVSLSSVLLTANLKMAIFRENQGGVSRRVRLGDLLEGSGWRLVSLEPRRAVLEGPTGQRSLDLLVYSGKGGELPTPMVAADANGSPNVAPMPAPVAMVQNIPAPSNVVASTSAPVNQNMTQEQQIEAIRQRITARRAQMQADAAKAASDAKK